MTVEQIPSTAVEGIALKSRRDEPRRRRLERRRVTRRRVDAARAWLTRFTPSANGHRTGRS